MRTKTHAQCGAVTDAAQLIARGTHVEYLVFCLRCADISISIALPW